MGALKYAFPILAEVFKSEPSPGDTVSQIVKMLRKALATEILRISARLMAGIIISSIIIYSLVAIGQQLSFLLLTIDDSRYLSVGVFLGITVFCTGLLLLLFRTDGPSRRKDEEQNPLGLDGQKILLKFLAGVAEGLEKEEEKNKNLEAPTPDPKELAYAEGLAMSRLFS